MKKIFSWPWVVVIPLALFIVMTLAFLKVAFSRRVDLVSKDYYYKDKEYSLRMEKTKNLLEKGETTVERNPSGITIRLPQSFKNQQVEGSAYFYSPLNPADDFEKRFEFVGERSEIVAELSREHLWKVTLDFNVGNDKFFIEKYIQ